MPFLKEEWRSIPFKFFAGIVTQPKRITVSVRIRLGMLTRQRVKGVFVFLSSAPIR